MHSTSVTMDDSGCGLEGRVCSINVQWPFFPSSSPVPLHSGCPRCVPTKEESHMAMQSCPFPPPPGVLGFWEVTARRSSLIGRRALGRGVLDREISSIHSTPQCTPGEPPPPSTNCDTLPRRQWKTNGPFSFYFIPDSPWMKHLIIHMNHQHVPRYFNQVSCGPLSRILCIVCGGLGTGWGWGWGWEGTSVVWFHLLSPPKHQNRGPE